MIGFLLLMAGEFSHVVRIYILFLSQETFSLDRGLIPKYSLVDSRTLGSNYYFISEITAELLGCQRLYLRHVYVFWGLMFF